jgi:hypothetical protein
MTVVYIIATAVVIYGLIAAPTLGTHKARQRRNRRRGAL